MVRPRDVVRESSSSNATEMFVVVVNFMFMISAFRLGTRCVACLCNETVSESDPLGKNPGWSVRKHGPAVVGTLDYVVEWVRRDQRRHASNIADFGTRRALENALSAGRR